MEEEIISPEETGEKNTTLYNENEQLYINEELVVDIADSLEQGYSADVKDDFDENVKEKGKSKLTDIIWYFFFSVVLVITILSCCSVAIFDCYIVDGRSMVGTVKDGDRVTVCVWDKPKVGDVIVLKKDYSDTLLIKRFIAKGPALIKIDVEGNVYVNDLIEENNQEGITDENGYDKLNEPYVLPENKSRDGSGGLINNIRYEDESGYFVEEGKIFYLGDNRRHSTDSRTEGAVNASLIVGKVSDQMLKIKDKPVYKILNNHYIDKLKQKIKRK